MSTYSNQLQPALRNLLQRVVQFFHLRSSCMTHISADVQRITLNASCMTISDEINLWQLQLLYVHTARCSFQAFFPSTVRLWNRVPSDTCYLAPDSFRLEQLKINLIWSRTKFLSHCTARFYFLKLAQHRIPQHMNSTQRDITLQQSWRLYWKIKMNIITVIHWTRYSDCNERQC